nr:hypothetical protein FVER53263_08826 [Fusarium verticillioides]
MIAVRNGASATFDSRETIDAQVAEIKKITNGNFGKMMDASTYGYEVMVKALETVSDAKEKYLTSVDSCIARSPFSTPSSINEYRANLGHLCRPNERDGAQITSNIANWIPFLEKHNAAGTLKPLKHHVVDGVGWEKVIQGIEDMEVSEVEQLPTNAGDGSIDSAMVGRLGAIALCSELESSISRLSTLIDHDGLTLDADDAEQIIDDLRRFVVIAKERSIEKSRLSSNSTTYSTVREDNTKALGRDLKLIEGLILSAPIIAINQSVPGSRKLRSQLPHGTVIKQKRMREEIDVDQGYLTISTNKRRRICSGVANPSAKVNTFRDVVASIVFRPSNSPWMFSVSLSQGQLFDRSIQSIPRISVCRIVPNDSPVFTLVKQGSLKEFITMLQEGKASLRDHDEQGMPLLHYAATASVEMCKFLIESGADVDEMGEHTGTALSRIAGLDRHDTTLVLLENMADPTLSYPGWDNPLSTACNLDLPSAELFLKHGGHFTMHDLESFDLNGRTRLHQVCMAESRATSKKKAVAMLAAAGANLNARVAKSWSPDDHQTLGFTCLHSLVYKAHRSRDRDKLEALIFLIQQGADILALDHHQHSVSMRAYLPNDGDNQYSSKGSYRGDLWDAALRICGYDVSSHRDAYPRVPRYNRNYRRKDFERLWEGYEALCPYWTDERYPETGGDDDYWKQAVTRCEHIACSDCEELPPQTDEVDVEPIIDAHIPGYAQAVYREWYFARSPESNPSHMPYIDHISDDYYSDNDGGEESPSPDIFEGEGRESSVDVGTDGGVRFYDEMNSPSPPSSEDGEAAYERLVEPYQDGQGGVDDYPRFVDRWLEHYIRAAEEEYEGDDEEMMD